MPLTSDWRTELRLWLQRQQAYLDSQPAPPEEDVPVHTHSNVSVATTRSIIGGGDLSQTRTLQLVGDVASPGADSFYRTNSGGSKGWSVVALNDLSNVTAPAPTSGQALVYNGTYWANATIGYEGGIVPEHTHSNLSVLTTNSLTGGGVLTQSRTLQLSGDASSPGANAFYRTTSTGVRGWSTTSINDLSNVSVAAPSTGQALTYNGAMWVNTTLDYGGGIVPTHLHPNISLTGTNSLSGGGDFSQSRTMQLVGDSSIPGGHAFYKTNASGVRGWSTADLESLSNVSVSSPIAGQSLAYNGSIWVNTLVPFESGEVPEHVHTNLSVLTTGSLTGGGNLSQSRTLQLSGDTASPGNNFFYRTSASGVKGWLATSFHDLSNVAVSAPETGQTITYNGTSWVNTTPSATLPTHTHSNIAVNTAQSLSGGGDLSQSRTLILQGDVTSPGNNSFYRTNSSGTRGWSTVALNDITSVAVGTPTAGQALTWSGTAWINADVPGTGEGVLPAGDIRWFGAMDGQPASNAIRAGLEAMYAGDFGVLVIPPGVWPIDTAINEAVRANTGVIAEGATFVPYNGVMGQIDINGLISSVSTTVESGAVRGSMTLVLASMTGVAVGDLIHITSDRDFRADNNIAPAHEKVQEVQVIREIDVATRTVWLDAPMIFTITPFAVGATVTCTVRKITRDFFWRGGTFDFQGIPDTGIVFSGFSNLHVQNAHFINSVRNHLRIISSAYDKTVNCHFLDAGNLTLPNQEYENIGGLSYGYGIIHTNSCYSSVMNCTAGSGWHSFESAGGTRDVRYISCVAHSNAYGFNSHAGVGRVTLDNCTSEGKLGIQAHSAEIFINGGFFYGHRAISSAWDRLYIIRCVGTVFESFSGNIIYMSFNALSFANNSIEFLGCTFKNGSVLMYTTLTKHVIFKDCTQINSFLEINGENIYIRDCMSISHASTTAVLIVNGNSSITTSAAYIDNYLSRTDSPVNDVIRASNLTVHVKNCIFDVARAGTASYILTNSSAGGAAYWYVTNCTFRSGGGLGRYQTHIRLLKDCIILQGTTFTQANGATIEHQEGNVFLDSL